MDKDEESSNRLCALSALSDTHVDSVHLKTTITVEVLNRNAVIRCKEISNLYKSKKSIDPKAQVVKDKPQIFIIFELCTYININPKKREIKHFHFQIVSFGSKSKLPVSRQTKSNLK